MSTCVSYRAAKAIISRLENAPHAEMAVISAISSAAKDHLKNEPNLDPTSTAWLGGHTHAHNPSHQPESLPVSQNVLELYNNRRGEVTGGSACLVEKGDNVGAAARFISSSYQPHGSPMQNRLMAHA